MIYCQTLAIEFCSCRTMSHPTVKTKANKNDNNLTQWFLFMMKANGNIRYKRNSHSFKQKQSNFVVVELWVNLPLRLKPIKTITIWYNDSFLWWTQIVTSGIRGTHILLKKRKILKISNRFQFILSLSLYSAQLHHQSLYSLREPKAKLVSWTGPLHN